MKKTLEENKIQLVDTHAHLTFKSFKKDLDKVITRAKEAGIIFIIDSAIDADDFLKALKLKERFPQYIFVTLGAAPQQLTPQKLEKVLDFAEKYKGEYVGIGECGLDYYWVKNPEQREFTKKAFYQLAELAKTLDKPLIIHCREAFDDTFEIVQKVKPDRVLWHAFSDTPQNAIRAIEAGHYISIPTIAVRSELHQRVIMKIPLERIVLETDSPFLAPKPRTRNEPANVRVLAEFIAKLKQRKLEEIAKITTDNAIRIFNLGKIKNKS